MEEKNRKDITMSDEELKDHIQKLYDRTKLLRDSEKISWDDFKDKVGVHYNTVKTWNTQKNSKDKRINKTEKISVPNLSSILSIAYHYNVSLDWLVGYSTNKESTPIPSTYEEWLYVIEKYLDNGVVRQLYRPELDFNTSTLDAEDENASRAFIDNIMSGGTVHEKTEKMPPTKQIPMEDNFGLLSYTYNPHPDNIYDVANDMDGIYPDILEIKDTFLRCILSFLYYRKKKESKESYSAFREIIIEQFGKKLVLNFDVYELNTSTYKKETIQDLKKFKQGESVAEMIFGKYNSIRDIGIKELKEIWDALNFWKEKLDSGKIKTKAEAKMDFFDKLEDEQKWDI